MTLDGFVEWLADTPLSVQLGAHDWITPSVQTVHIIAIAVIMAAILMTCLKALGLTGSDQTLAQFSRAFAPWIVGALIVLVLSGSTLIVGEPKRSLENPVFGLKMALLLVALALTVTIHAPLRQDELFWTIASRQLALRSIVAVSLLVWTAIIFAGRWIAYV
jgi:hypothetical protein